jgi:hypothetical protein
MNDPIRDALDKAIAESRDGWAMTPEEYDNLYAALRRYYDEHGELPEIDLTSRGENK